MSRRSVAALVAAGVAGLGLLAAVLYYQLPRRVAMELPAVILAKDDAPAQQTTLHFSGSWTPELWWWPQSMEELDYFFRGSVWVDAVELEGVDMQGEVELRFPHGSDPAQRVGSFFYYTEPTEGAATQVAACVFVYYAPEQETCLVWVNGSNVVAPANSEAEALEALEEANLVAVTDIN